MNRVKFFAFYFVTGLALVVCATKLSMNTAPLETMMKVIFSVQGFVTAGMGGLGLFNHFSDRLFLRPAP